MLHEELARQGAEAGVQEVVVASEEHGVPRVLELVAAAAPYRRAWPVVRAFSVAVDLLALEAGGSVRGKEEWYVQGLIGILFCFNLIVSFRGYRQLRS